MSSLANEEADQLAPGDNVGIKQYHSEGSLPLVKQTTEDYVQNMENGQASILVAVRVRPLLKHDRTQQECIRILDRKVVMVLDPAKVLKANDDILRLNRSKERYYAFDIVFEPHDTQEMVYNRTTKFLLQGILDGFNATVFAYGNTGAGKTHTMIGNPGSPGIMVRGLEELFQMTESTAGEQGVVHKVTVSFLEVYNENIRDLLSDVEEYLDLREDPIKGPTVAGITEVETKSVRDVMELLQAGNRKRTQQATHANEVSSRSHAVLQVVVETRDRAPGTVATIKIGKLSLVDLAGSERAANTQNRGLRLQEGANINRSLLALGNCINALGEKGHKGQFVPYRDSKLTRLLKDSLGGNCRTVMIANISQSVSSFEETLNTLKYANRAKNIKTNVQRNVLDVNYHVSEYVALINNLKGEISKLKLQFAQQQEVDKLVDPLRPSLPPIHPGPSLSELDPSFPMASRRPPSVVTQSVDRQAMEEFRQMIVENFRERMQLRRSLIELEDQNVENSIGISKRQLVLMEYLESKGLHSPHRDGRDTNSIASEDGITLLNNVNREMMEDAPPTIKERWMEVEELKMAIDKNNSIKKQIAKRLRANEKNAEKFHEDISNRINGEERRELMELQYKIGKLELENMELEQSRVIHESIMRGKDLSIQKLQLQLSVCQKIIEQQRSVLVSNLLDHLVNYNHLSIVYDETLAPSFDTLRKSTAQNAFNPLLAVTPSKDHMKDVADTDLQVIWESPSPSLEGHGRTRTHAPHQSSHGSTGTISPTNSTKSRMEHSFKSPEQQAMIQDSNSEYNRGPTDSEMNMVIKKKSGHKAAGGRHREGHGSSSAAGHESDNGGSTHSLPGDHYRPKHHPRHRRGSHGSTPESSNLFELGGILGVVNAPFPLSNLDNDTTTDNDDNHSVNSQYSSSIESRNHRVPHHGARGKSNAHPITPRKRIRMPKSGSVPESKATKLVAVAPHNTNAIYNAKPNPKSHKNRRHRVVQSGVTSLSKKPHRPSTEDDDDIPPSLADKETSLSNRGAPSSQASNSSLPYIKVHPLNMPLGKPKTLFQQSPTKHEEILGLPREDVKAALGFLKKNPQPNTNGVLNGKGQDGDGDQDAMYATENSPTNNKAPAPSPSALVVPSSPIVVVSLPKPFEEVDEDPLTI